MDIKFFLKVLSRYGYPNPNVHSVAKMVGYNLEDFLFDLKQELGDDGVSDFCEKAIFKLTGDKGLKIEVNGPTQTEYVYIHIYPTYYDENESHNDVICRYAWGDSKILSADENGQEVYKTIDEIVAEADMSDWSEIDDMVDYLKDSAYTKVYTNCGFGIWWT